MRHICQAPTILLSGNYKNGSLSSSTCVFHEQFAEKECRDFVSPHSYVCNNKVQIKNANRRFGGWFDSLDHCKTEKTDRNILLFSFGNYPSKDHGNYDAINNATADALAFQKQIFPPIVPLVASHFGFLLAHRRIWAYNDTLENPSRTQSLN